MPPNLASYTQPQDMAKEYLSNHRVQQMFSSLLSALMLHRPEDPVEFIQHTLNEVCRGFVIHFVLSLHRYGEAAGLDICF